MELNVIPKDAELMYDYCIKNNLGYGFNKTWGKKHFSLILKELKQDEIVYLTFIGMHNYKSSTKHDNYFAYALTNQRFIIAQKKMIGETVQTISLKNVNDITMQNGLIFGVVTIDTMKEKFNVGITKKCTKNIYNKLHETLDYINSNNTNNKNNDNNNSNIEKLKQYKELYDNKVISKEEFEEIKKKLLINI